jgi:hypothetical protein
MRNIAVIGFATIAFAAAGLSALANDQSVSLATGTIDGSPWDAPHAQVQSPKYASARRAAQTRYSDYAEYNDAPHGNYALSGDSGYAPWRCTYTGGPKSSVSWACQ